MKKKLRFFFNTLYDVIKYEVKKYDVMKYDVLKYDIMKYEVKKYDISSWLDLTQAGGEGCLKNVSEVFYRCFKFV